MELPADTLARVRRQVEQDTGAARAVAKAGKEAVAQRARLTGELERHDRVTQLLTTISEGAQATARQQIEELVTRGLQVIFGTELSFHMAESVKGNASSIEFVVRSVYGDSVVETPVMESRGGGLAVVVAFMLRLVVLLLTPGAPRILWLDESFSHVSAEYEPRLAEFLREVCDKAQVQIVMVTHSDAYNDLADVRYRLMLGNDGITQVLQAEGLTS